MHCQMGERTEEGFTLVELVVTLVVIGILTSVAIVALNGLNQKSNASACEASMDAAKNATAAYYTRVRAYPQTFADLTSPPAAKPWLEPSGRVTQPTLTTLQGPGGSWTLTLKAGASASAQTTFACT
jgi:prepilin-type N-terminal cleavage/methylation domain-containing protein